MGMFEDIIRYMDSRKTPVQSPSVKPIGYLPPEITQNPQFQQEMIRDPALEQRIRDYLLKRGSQAAPIYQ